MYKFIWPLVAGACCSGLALAQSPSVDATHAILTTHTDGAPMSLALALELVLRDNRQLAAASREVDARDSAVFQAGAMPNPELAALVEDTRRETRTITLQVNQPVELGGKRAARQTAARQGRRAAVAELGAQRSAIRAATITAFYHALAAQERHRLAAESVELADGALAATARRVQAGKNSPVDETKARIAASSARIDLAQAKSESVSARARLAALWGGGASRFGTLTGPLDVIAPLVPLELLAKRLAQSPEMQRALIEVDRRLAMTQVEQARRVPDLTVSIGSKRDEQLGRNQAVFGVAVPLPLFDHNLGNLREALHRRDKARDELSTTESRLYSELAQAHAQLSMAYEQIQLLQDDMLPGARSAFDAARKGFDYGKFGFSDVIDAHRTLLQAQSQRVRAFADAHRAAAEIERIIGDNAAAVTGAPVPPSEL